MTRNFNLIDRLTSAKSAGAILLALGALVLPACGVGQEEGLGEEQEYQEEGQGLGEEGIGEEEGLGEEEVGDD